MIVLIDNFDSFTYNLYQYISGLGKEVVVVQNDTALHEVEALRPSAIILSPGPGNPNSAGVSLEVVHHFHNRIPLLGICLGHQVIAQYFGGEIVKATRPMHGKVSRIHHDGRTVFAGTPNSFNVVRYHSLVVNPQVIPDCMEVSARTASEEIMAIRHKDYPIEGVQFHPESILSEQGMALIQNFLKIVEGGD